MQINPLTCIDFYKADHRRQYPEGTTLVYSNFTPRSSTHARVLDGYFDDKVVFFGLQYFIKEFLMGVWVGGFFNQPKDEVIACYKRRMDNALGMDSIPTDHIEALHDLGYLPIEIRAVEEGSRVDIRVPLLTIHNTLPEFFWLTNYLETVMSCMLWKPITSATTAYQYRQLLEAYADKTGADKDFINFQAHDFSFRGMSGIQDAALSGAAHLTSFWGTDTVAAIDLLEDYYGADVESEPVGFSVPATEHSVMCMGGEDNEIDTFRRLITELYPKGIVSIVSDSWDFWRVVTDYVTDLKDEIMARDGKVVIRPDSGDPVDIICGDNHTTGLSEAEQKGAVECLWGVFGGTTNEAGHKVLDPHIGIIYGDSITLERAEAILANLEAKGFASSNIVFGVGSFTYQHATRDNFGFAMKATYGEVNGEGRDIFKDPKTDDGIKKSAKGLIQVNKEGDMYTLHDQQNWTTTRNGELQPVFVDGELIRETKLSEIRNRLL